MRACVGFRQDVGLLRDDRLLAMVGHGAQEEDGRGWDWGVAEDVAAGLAAGDAKPACGVVLLHAEAGDGGLEFGAGHGALGLPSHSDRIVRLNAAYFSGPLVGPRGSG
jgi:hypothetical protein